ncbi:hypothetical protein K0M31_019178 [Melipona bicolor]|uniref:Uncharacterized protein n=1 Tax=Melipona bicolor TaxID=60889 RepID=A0AA40KQW9_9HYME|nr:hypothetical protein K0M31_019178 [Melipona bicolor]
MTHVLDFVSRDTVLHQAEEESSDAEIIEPYVPTATTKNLSKPSTQLKFQRIPTLRTRYMGVRSSRPFPSIGKRGPTWKNSERYARVFTYFFRSGNTPGETCRRQVRTCPPPKNQRKPSTLLDDG